ncbi:hypothetical protein ACFV1N_05890 [Streptosporangium canum]|uniref:hypothetical protein n=1 Tax=Streptosporangium canum TaxID=324952 RepID=UPI0036D12788
MTCLFSGSPGYISVCSNVESWVGRRFTTDNAGLTAATDYALWLDRRRAVGVYAQATTLREHPPEKKRGGEDLAYAVTHLWADGDFGTIGHKPGPDDLPHPPDADAIAKVVAESGLPEPTMWAQTGGGYNPVWLLDQPYVISDDAARTSVKELTTAWQAILAAQAYRHGWCWDDEVGNLDRLMKLAGTINRKEGIERPTGIVLGTDQPYKLADLRVIAERLLPEAELLLKQAKQEKQARRATRLGRPLPQPPPRVSARQRSAEPVGDGPFSVLAEHFDLFGLFQSGGFTYLGIHSDGRHKWHRPTIGGDAPSSAFSLLHDDHVAVNFSERSGLPVGAQPPGKKLTVPVTWVWLNYGYDAQSQAAADILRAAAGRGEGGPALSLPAAVLEEVKRRCLRLEVKDRPSAPPDRGEARAGEEKGEPRSAAPPEPALSLNTPPVLPEEFWNARPMFGHIRQAAYSRLIAPDGVFAAVMVRGAVSLDYRVIIPPIVARPQPPNLYAGLVAGSGGGKGASLDTASELLPFVSTDDHRIREVSAGSGEGLAKKFFAKVTLTDERGKSTGTDWKQSWQALLVRVDEGSMFGPLMKRQGQTTTETLRSAWSGERLGGSYADEERGQQLAPHTYRLCIALGIQPETAAFLFDDVYGGLPQRFLWLAVQAPKMPPLDALPDWPGQLRWSPPLITGRDLRANIAGLQRCIVDIAPEIAHEIRVAHVAQVEGRSEANALDGHANLSRLKVATVLGALDGRLSVTVEDWEIAGIVMRTSSAVRTWIRGRVQLSEAATRKARNKEHVEREVMAENAKENAKITRMAKRAHRYVGLIIADGEKAIYREVNRRFGGTERHLLGDAIQYALSMDWIRRDGEAFVLGESTPR